MESYKVFQRKTMKEIVEKYKRQLLGYEITESDQFLNP